MPENKATVYRTSSYLSHSAYRKIKRVLSFRRRVFGQRLEETVLYERRYGVHMAPLVVEQCVDFIRERGLLEVGLFRQPGQATLVKELQDAFDAGEKPSFDSSTDVHTVASLLKLYLRELPEPLVPFSRYQDFLVCGKKISSERKQVSLHPAASCRPC
ncbi:rho GTPase-activating protein 24-like [Salvelinus namaycush]|uniref:Rho GTPase-activating protein 24-like n=1 Tax=Salvelinus namaycush TaxID=8040 RepID=A0A8U0TN73_SALNM|nr:rho GTPase-activating protein 24-like [Salvelinus namaycush]